MIKLTLNEECITTPTQVKNGDKVNIYLRKYNYNTPKLTRVKMFTKMFTTIGLPKKNLFFSTLSSININQVLTPRESFISAIFTSSEDFWAGNINMRTITTMRADFLR